ncbi:hypothetical protein CL633_01270 [bacterium]|mgnify:CR=1 FL=1|nr:hypothetical protein [bacterium]|tara:strand:- start:6113 stop:6319 length:207 start_codon:yes stop_codon:yes gene_type:complete
MYAQHYSPIIKLEQVRKLFMIKEASGVPMTKLVEQAMNNFLKRKKNKKLIKAYVIKLYYDKKDKSKNK